MSILSYTVVREKVVFLLLLHGYITAGTSYNSYLPWIPSGNEKIRPLYVLCIDITKYFHFLLPQT